MGGQCPPPPPSPTPLKNVTISPVYTGILIQILIWIGCVYTEANWIQIQTQTTSNSNPDLGPGACVNAAKVTSPS